MLARDMGDSDVVLARADVFEVDIRLAWLRTHPRALSEAMWGLELELAGVYACAGRRTRAGTAQITGTLPTAPELRVTLDLVAVDDTTHRLCAYTFEEIRAPV